MKRLITAVAMLAGSVVAAVAQTAPTSPTAPSDHSATPSMNQCWDSSMNKMRDETIQIPGSAAGSGSSTTGSGSATAPSSNRAGSGSTAAQTRPAEARGLADCRH